MYNHVKADNNTYWSILDPPKRFTETRGINHASN